MCNKSLPFFLVLRALLTLALGGWAAGAGAANWYVRPEAPAGSYGRADGSSYANAFNGLTAGDRTGKAGVVWGAAGVKAGDTLYICGNHWLQISKPADSFFHGRIAIPVQGISDLRPVTIRCDAAGAPGIVWGYGRNTALADAWSGPDANGVYRLGRDLGDYIAQDVTAGDQGVVYLTKMSATTWSGNLGAFCRSGGATYVKTSDGKSPAGRLYTGDIAYRFALLRNQYITFKNCNFPGFLMDIDRDENGERITTLPRSSHITFDGCAFRYGTQNFFQLYDGDDYWQFINCTMEYAPCAIYTYGLMGGVGASYLTVRGCTFRHLGVLMFPHQDAHGVGVQRGQGHLIEHNSFEDTGTAVEFWTSSGNPMRNMTVCYNFIKSPKIKSITEGCGIVVSGENGNTLGERTGFNIYGNIIMNAEGAGISSNNPDPMVLSNNVVYNCASGIRFEVAGGGVKATVKNNIVVNPRQHFVVCAGIANRLSWDNNLYYSATGSAATLWAPWGSFAAWSQEMGTDVHARLLNPKFVSASPAQATDFKLQAGSPAIDAGANVGLTADFAGAPVSQGTAPDLGAFEYGISPAPMPTPTPIPTPIPTPTPTPAPTPPASSLLFNMTQETGNLSAYDAVVNLGGLSVSSVAGQADTKYGLCVTPTTDGDQMAVGDIQTPSSGILHWRLYFNADDLVLPLNGYLSINRLDATTGNIISVNLINLGGQINLNVDTRKDGGWFDDCNVPLARGSHWVEIAVRRASASGVADGDYKVYVDNVLEKTFAAVPSYALFGEISSLSLGAMGTPASTTGAVLLDEFAASSADALIGPASYASYPSLTSAVSAWRQYE